MVLRICTQDPCEELHNYQCDSLAMRSSWRRARAAIGRPPVKGSQSPVGPLLLHDRARSILADPNGIERARYTLEVMVQA